MTDEGEGLPAAEATIPGFTNPIRDIAELPRLEDHDFRPVDDRQRVLGTMPLPRRQTQ